MRLIALTILALTGFAANSLLTRSAFIGGHLDAWTFMLVRLIAGALTLAALRHLRGSVAQAFPRAQGTSGTWLMAAWLAGYAVLFTLAYVRIAAGPGALLLFGSVQLTMFAAALSRGERLSTRHWLGVALAVTGFLVLTLPGLTAPDAIGAALMAGAGACWGAYSLAGRRSADPLSVTAGNFLRASAVMLGVVLIQYVALESPLRGPLSATGFALAITSGAIASGVAYAAWYAVLPSLPVWRAATVQLSVPILTALGATAFLGERVTSRLGAAMVLVVAGMWLTTASRPARAARRSVRT